jgi:hypothetical protein
MTLKRRTFSIASIAAGASVTLWLQACGGGGGYSSGGSSGGSSTCGAGAGDITDNHGHTLAIAKADLDSTTAKTYDLAAGADGHRHQVTFTPAQLALMKSGSSVSVTSTVTVASGPYGGTHSHQVTAQVAVATCP